MSNSSSFVDLASSALLVGASQARSNITIEGLVRQSGPAYPRWALISASLLLSLNTASLLWTCTELSSAVKTGQALLPMRPSFLHDDRGRARFALAVDRRAAWRLISLLAATFSIASAILVLVDGRLGTLLVGSSVVQSLVSPLITAGLALFIVGSALGAHSSTERPILTAATNNMIIGIGVGLSIATFAFSFARQLPTSISFTRTVRSTINRFANGNVNAKLSITDVETMQADLVGAILEGLRADEDVAGLRALVLFVILIIAVVVEGLGWQQSREAIKVRPRAISLTSQRTEATQSQMRTGAHPICRLPSLRFGPSEGLSLTIDSPPLALLSAKMESDEMSKSSGLRPLSLASTLVTGPTVGEIRRRRTNRTINAAALYTIALFLLVLEAITASWGSSIAQDDTLASVTLVLGDTLVAVILLTGQVVCSRSEVCEVGLAV